MSESRPLANTLPQASASNCPLFNPNAPAQDRRWAASSFGLFIVALTLFEAVYRLGTRAVLSVREGLSPAHWGLLLVSVVAFAYGEGYRALHRRFVPHVLARASELSTRAGLGLRDWLLAPFFLLCLAQAEPAELRRAWLSVGLIVAAVVVVRQLPEPYRGIIDAGVAVALCIGLCSLIFGAVTVVRPRTQRS
jgi:hypothetical protein